jgi:hypothetical protein
MTRGGSECSDFVEIAECNGSYQEVYSRSGLPLAIRSDNGVPFASPTGLFNLSKLSVWWLRLGIAIERNGLLVFGPVIVHHALKGLIDLVEDEGAG